MAQITIQYGCGHDRVIETPGPEDPEGLLARKAATRGAVHRAPASKCPACESAAPVAFPIDALEAADKQDFPAIRKVLLIDDEAHRFDSIQKNSPAGLLVVWVHDKPANEQAVHAEKWDGLLLDHDLYDPTGITGLDVARMVAETQNPATCRIFIHSQNAAGAAQMRELLAGFPVTVSPWDNASGTAPGLAEWLNGILQTSATASA